MGDILDFKSKPKMQYSKQMVDMQISQDSEGYLEVSCQITDGYTDYEIFEALIAAAYKFAEDTDLVEEPTLN